MTRIVTTTTKITICPITNSNMNILFTATRKLFLCSQIVVYWVFLLLLLLGLLLYSTVIVRFFWCWMISIVEKFWSILLSLLSSWYCSSLIMQFYMIKAGCCCCCNFEVVTITGIITYTYIYLLLSSLCVHFLWSHRHLRLRRWRRLHFYLPLYLRFYLFPSPCKYCL